MTPDDWALVTTGAAPPGGSFRSTQRLTLDAQPIEVRRARQFARNVLRDLNDDFVERVMLLLSEVVTNAILYARTPTEVTISLQHYPNRPVDAVSAVLIGVADRSPVLPQQRHSADLGENGRGLHIVNEIADEWGCTPLESPPGKIVWFQINVPT